MLLAGDIGGSKTDLAVFSADSGPRAPLARAEYPSADYPSLEAMARAFLAQVSLPVDRACFAVAGPVLDGRARTTNLPWLVDAAALAADLGLVAVYLLNDLEAAAISVPLLEATELHQLNAGEPVTGGSLAIIAPGTGLGEGFLTWDGARYRAHASEGGHADFAPADDLQVGLLQYLRQDLEHVSFERVCSGLGIPHLYDYLQAQGMATELPEVAAALAAAEDRTPVIVEAALHSSAPSPRCAAALDLFVSILGAEAGNLALKVLATGGVYLGGGIPPRILPALGSERFMAAFRRKGRFSELVGRMPVYVIRQQTALLGAASHALEPERRGDAR